jgi:hypothetical protein
MISTKDANDHLSSNICFLCKQPVRCKKGVATYYVWANMVGKLSIKVKFHKECFQQIAGDDYLFEEY